MAESFLFVAADKDIRLDSFLAERTGRSRMFVKRQIEKGHIAVNLVKVAKPSLRLKPGDTVGGHFEEEALSLQAVEGALDILYEDEHFIIINKPQGLVVHPALGHRSETLVHYLLHHLRHCSNYGALEGPRPGIVHRLDRGTSGVMVIAKDSLSLEKLARQFHDRTVAKEYESIVYGRTKERGSFASAIGRHVSRREKMSSKTRRAREAFTGWEKIGDYAHFSHLLLKPKTGRTHQLRVHLSENGTPIVGDRTYGPSRPQVTGLSPVIGEVLDTTDYPFLHARSLTLNHPDSGKTMTFTAPRPDRFSHFLTLLMHFDKRMDAGD
ncbi:MAG: RluA family pseudouridine synthase [Deltaproteobacteria bacterium]|nr:RluA family pseudouridine synthase [Deltaproteobacteria bacterium]